MSDADAPTLEDFSYRVRPSCLSGEVHLSGAKNSVLRLLAASILTSSKIDLLNYPNELLDAKIHVDMLSCLGKTSKVSPGTITMEEHQDLSTNLDWDGRSIRNTLLVLGALTTRFGEGRVPLPGGCNLGDRKYDLHEMLLRKFGAKIWTQDGFLCASSSQRLQGCEIHLPIRSTGATENAIICGTLANGVTNVWNPHIRPEILDLVRFLRSMGAEITVYGQERIEIVGREHLGGTTYRALADNMEALTWLIAAVITEGTIEIHNFPYGDLEIPLIHLRESGARFFRGDSSLIVTGGRCYPFEISTGPYPGINSDMQPLFAVFGAMARGQSVIVDLRFPGRYGYVKELAKMGVQYQIKENLLVIDGGNPLHGQNVQALDLRAGIALTLAGLAAAKGETIITDAWQIERGYNSLLTKIKDLGGDIDYA
ncbi:UDP-N-acetylglucosamine 1-carboxyvinyltransferase MurA [Rubripirellula obstinata]|uniref:UDP-N-acetylglucosamine 1-carboxyvinyltransferase n=1 Tax=Rubripirellula obstinata TaxID=406547 RepID=A0A5B1CMJ6_9BACT|nr:UDP-N-acetylglucosamine 1-carboxyvinyltransferase [Rubripirellula obstinata]KAA1260999.1 UDP-N-acetylglucosamine 1-carboxyvinyltransferase MurA [Rubripirellula obstinata]